MSPALTQSHKFTLERRAKKWGRFFAPDREGGQIIICAHSRAGRRVVKNLDHLTILIYRPRI